METANKETAWLKITEVELIHKSAVKASERPLIKTSSEAAGLFRKIWNVFKIELIEEAKLLLLNRANKALGVLSLSSGGVSGTVVDLKVIFAVALKANACNIILCHNHPSGNLKPSRQDEELTQKIRVAGQLLEIKLLDHVILTKEGYYSFADEGLL